MQQQSRHHAARTAEKGRSRARVFTVQEITNELNNREDGIYILVDRATQSWNVIYHYPSANDAYARISVVAFDEDGLRSTQDFDNRIEKLTNNSAKYKLLNAYGSVIGRETYHDANTAEAALETYEAWKKEAAHTKLFKAVVINY